MICNTFTIEIRTHLAQMRPGTMHANVTLSEQKRRKMVKKGVILTGAILIIIVKGYCIL